ITGTADDIPVAGSTVAYRDDLNTAYLDLNQPLAVGAYRVLLKAPLADLAGNVIVASPEWIFAVVNSYTIVYSRVGTPEGTVWQVGGDGSSDHQITTGEHPRLAPDGEHLIFLRGGGSANFARGSIFIRDLAVTNETELFANGDFVVGFDWQ